jgi:hypothetical protein
MREQDNNSAAKHARILQAAVELFTEEHVTRQVLSYFWRRRQFVTLIHRLENNIEGEEQADWQRRRDSIVGVFADLLYKGVPQALPSGQMRLLTEMFLGMLRSIVLYHGAHDTPDTMAPLAVQLFLNGLSNLTPALEHSDIRLTAGGKSRVRATVRRAITLG